MDSEAINKMDATTLSLLQLSLMLPKKIGDFPGRRRGLTLIIKRYKDTTLIGADHPWGN